MLGLHPSEYNMAAVPHDSAKIVSDAKFKQRDAAKACLIGKRDLYKSKSSLPEN